MAHIMAKPTIWFQYVLVNGFQGLTLLDSIVLNNPEKTRRSLLNGYPPPATKELGQSEPFVQLLLSLLLGLRSSLLNRPTRATPWHGRVGMADH